MMRRSVCVTLVGAFVLCGVVVSGQNFGKFVGRVTATWMPDGRRMELAEDFAYIDPTGKKWTAPTGSIVDGASIPRIAWTVIGGPFEGTYRDASVLHDVACVLRKDKWQKVHRMFYDAMQRR